MTIALRIHKSSNGYSLQGPEDTYQVTTLDETAPLSERSAVRDFIISCIFYQINKQLCAEEGIAIGCKDVNGELVAGAWLFLNGEQATLEGMAVCKPLRRKGLGNALCTIAFHEASKAQCKEVTLKSSISGTRLYDTLQPTHVTGRVYTFTTNNYKEI